MKWTTGPNSEGIASPIIVGEHVYRLLAPGILRCWRASDGKQVYTHRLDGISSTWATPIADETGRIFLASAGKSFVVQAGPEFKVLAENDLGDPNHASPAVARGRMLLLGVKNLYCIGPQGTRR